MRYGRAMLCVMFCGSAAWAQSVISAHSGVVHYVEGDVTIDGAGIHPRFAEFPDLKDGQVLATEEGRVEVLLTPGVFLRLAENSSVRMISNSLVDTRVEVVSGSALVEAGELLANNAVTFESHGAQIAIPKKGLYRIDADSARLQVYDGQAIVSSASEKATASSIARRSPTRSSTSKPPIRSIAGARGAPNTLPRRTSQPRMSLRIRAIAQATSVAAGAHGIGTPGSECLPLFPPVESTGVRLDRRSIAPAS